MKLKIIDKMKTIEKATDENTSIHVEHGTVSDCLYTTPSYLKKILDGTFKSGVEFAQRWIPIEEELPEENITVIAKGGIAIWISAMSKGRLIGYKFSSPGITESFDATHWRPIEYK